jgi:tol-pal system-associated acyl-CoA thioesterase
MKAKAAHYAVQIYYEDTDHSGVVYHANYLKYFERARENLIGTEELVRLWEEEGIGFSVYRVEMGFFDGACFGDRLDIRTSCEPEGKYKVVFHQEAWRPEGKKPAVRAVIEMVCLDRNRRVRPVPPSLLTRERPSGGMSRNRSGSPS